MFRYGANLATCGAILHVLPFLFRISTVVSSKFSGPPKRELRGSAESLGVAEMSSGASLLSLQTLYPISCDFDAVCIVEYVVGIRCYFPRKQIGYVL